MCKYKHSSEPDLVYFPIRVETSSRIRDGGGGDDGGDGPTTDRRIAARKPVGIKPVWGGERRKRLHSREGEAVYRKVSCTVDTM